MNNEKITLAIDFDGMITTEDEYPNTGKLRSGAIEYINKLHEEGCFIIINSCRTGEEQKIAEKFLNENNIKFNLFNKNDPERIEKYGKDTRKISADIYIDDKNLGGIFEWKEIYELIHEQIDEI